MKIRYCKTITNLMTHTREQGLELENPLQGCGGFGVVGGVGHGSC